MGGLPAGAVVGTTVYLDASPPDARLEVDATAWLRRLGHRLRNVRSQRVIARLGARHEGTLRRYQRRADGKVRDPWLFSVTAEDWPAVRRLLWTRGHPLTLRPVAPTLVA